MTEGLHPRRAQILEVLARAVQGGQEVPTEREIGLAVGLKSSQTVHHHLQVLEADGYIEREEAPSRKRRPVRLTQKGWEAVGSMPMLGRIAAGRGLEAVAVEGETYSLPLQLFAHTGKRRYTLRVVGQSMSGAGIEDGDLLMVEENEDPPDGTVVVALLGDGEEATVKRLYREGEMVRLVPQNGEHEEIVVTAEEVRIQGEVVYVLHPPRRP